MDDQHNPAETIADAIDGSAPPPATAPGSAPAPAPTIERDPAAAARVAMTRSRLLFLLVGGWLLLAVLLAGFAILAFGITTFRDVLAPCAESPCAPVEPVDPLLVGALIVIALVAGFLGFGVSAAPTRRALAVSCAAAVVICLLSIAWTVIDRELVALAPTILALPIAAVSWVAWSMTEPPPR